MKIAFLNKYQEKVNRGAETFVQEVSSRLKKNHQVEVISNINYFNLLKNKYDLIIPTNGRLQVVLVRLITWLRKEKMLVSGQSGIGFDDRLNLYCFPDIFVALSDFACRWAKKVNPFVSVIKIPNGVDPKVFKPEKVNHNQKTVLAVGAFTKEKRHDLTISAVAGLKDVKLIIAGSRGPLKSETEALGRKLLADRLEILSVSHQKMPEVYRRASAFCYPTVPWESFGIAMVEAMASDLPVVANNDPIRREIVGEAGLLVNPVDIKAYTAALAKALKTDWGSKPRHQAEKFNWDTIAEKYENILKSF